MANDEKSHKANVVNKIMEENRKRSDQVYKEIRELIERTFEGGKLDAALEWLDDRASSEPL